MVMDDSTIYFGSEKPTLQFKGVFTMNENVDERKESKNVVEQGIRAGLYTALPTTVDVIKPKCTFFGFDGQPVACMEFDVPPAVGDTYELPDGDGGMTTYVVHSRAFTTKPKQDVDNEQGAELRAVQMMIVYVYKVSDVGSDHDYQSGGYIPNKYTVVKNDGTGTDPNAEYFVLRLDSDPHALQAAKIYADSVERENPVLANDVREIAGKMREVQRGMELKEKS